MWKLESGSEFAARLILEDVDRTLALAAEYERRGHPRLAESLLLAALKREAYAREVRKLG